MSGKFLSLSLFLAVAFCAVASAERLDPSLHHPHYPLVASDFVDVTYDVSGGMGTLTAIGYSAEFKADENDSTTLYGDFIMTIDVDPNTGAGLGGSLEVTEDWLTGVRLFYSLNGLQAFGWGTQLGDDIFEAIFIQQEGLAGTVGHEVGVILSAVGVAAPWDFTQPFDNLQHDGLGERIYYSGDGVSKTFYLPEPSAAAFLLLGCVGLVRRRTGR